MPSKSPGTQDGLKELRVYFITFANMHHDFEILFRKSHHAGQRTTQLISRQFFWKSERVTAPKSNSSEFWGVRVVGAKTPQALER